MPEKLWYLKIIYLLQEMAIFHWISSELLSTYFLSVTGAPPKNHLIEKLLYMDLHQWSIRFSWSFSILACKIRGWKIIRFPLLTVHSQVTKCWVNLWGINLPEIHEYLTSFSGTPNFIRATYNKLYEFQWSHLII